jgi:FAD synthetase
MKKVLAFGTFDLLHPGHLSYLAQAKSLGDKLIVIIATDSNVKKIKGKAPVNSEKERREMVANIKFVDEAVIGFEDDMINSVEKIKPEIIALGYDQKPSEAELEKMLAARGLKAKIVRLKPYKENMFKSSKIKEKIIDSAKPNN